MTVPLDQQKDAATLPIGPAETLLGFTSANRAVSKAVSDFATSAQGSKADSAVQPGDDPKPDFASRHMIGLQGLDTLFPDAASIAATYSYSSLYPQGVILDEVAGELLTLFNPNGGNGWCWVEIRTWPDLEYVSCFSAGNEFNEGGHVFYEDDIRYLDIGMGIGAGVGRFDITDTPANMERLSPETTFTLANKVQMAGRGSLRLVELSDYPLVQRRKYLHGLYDSSYAEAYCPTFD